MKKTARLLAALLAAALLAGLCTFPASAAKLDRATFEDLFRETAMAYYNKGPSVQYDGRSWTIQNRISYGGSTRPTSGMAPEEGSSDHTLYTVCSDYCYTVYKAAFGYELMGTPRYSITNKMVAVPASDPLCVVRYDPGGNDPGSIRDLDEAIRTARDALQIGDVIVSYGDSGHAMLYYGPTDDGKNCVIHCWGKSFNEETGAENYETSVKNANPEGGSIRIDSIDEVLPPDKSTSGVWNLRTANHNSSGFVILRPYATPEFEALTLSDAAKVRLKYRGLEVNKETDISRYRAPQTGDTLKLTVTVTNNGKDAYKGLAVTDTLPTGASLKDAGSGKVSGDKIAWTVDLEAGKSVDLSYTVTVTAARGETVTFPRGDVGGGLPTRTFSMKVGGKKLSATAQENAEKLRSGNFKTAPADYKWVEDPIEFANNVYNNVFGVGLDLPVDLNNYTKGLCERLKVIGVESQYGGWMWSPKTEGWDDTWKTVHDMIIPEHFTGRAVYLEGSPNEIRQTWIAVNRVQTYKTGSYEVGDIFLALQPPDVQAARNKDNVLVYVYLGDGKVAEYDKTAGVQIGDFENTVVKLLVKNIVLVLRPSLAYDDLNTRPAKEKSVTLPFTDVKEADWFYTYVKDLWGDGTVNGMTATTFVPNGNLTYGQALKLIALALGQKEQEPVSGGHWASGYQRLAVRNGWLPKTVDLDGKITRLQFCQIAAKAKSLTEQPDSNPFKDTSDPAVLALNKAGVINGMSADTFDPSGLLTRAQISKIIWVLRDL